MGICFGIVLITSALSVGNLSDYMSAYASPRVDCKSGTNLNGDRIVLYCTADITNAEGEIESLKLTCKSMAPDKTLGVDYKYICCPAGTDFVKVNMGDGTFRETCEKPREKPKDPPRVSEIYLKNIDDLPHTLTSGSVNNPGKIFDTSIVLPGKTVKLGIVPSGPAHCSIHPYEDAYANFRIVGAPIS